MRFDLSITLYCLSLFSLINFIFFFFNASPKLFKFNIAYLTFFFGLITFIGFVEIEFFRYFKVRLNSYSLTAAEIPEFVFKMILEMYPVPIYVFFILLITSSGFIFIYLIQNKFTLKSKSNSNIINKVLSFIIAIILIFIGIRGTLSTKTPLRWGHAYFSTINSANQLALNGIFCFLDEVLSSQDSDINLETHYAISNKEQAYKLVEDMTNDSIAKVFTFPFKSYKSINPEKNYSVVLIIMESFSSYDIDNYEKNNSFLFFNKIKNEGIYFENFYSNGFHTYLGLFCPVFGMPGTFGKSIMLRNEGQQEFSGLVNILKKKNYKTYFGVSHDPNFDNMAGFLKGNGIDHIISEFDFDSDEVLSTLGVPDHRLFEKMNDRFKNEKDPFLAIILTTNNHGPWIIPTVKGKSFKNTFEYTDWALEHFLTIASNENYGKNTIFVITADHGVAKNPIYDLDLQLVRIPLLIYNPEIIAPQKVKTIGSHTDISQIILNYLSLNYETWNFGRDILNMNNHYSGFAAIQEYKTLGFITDEWYLIDRVNGKSSLYKYNSDNPKYDYSNEEPIIMKNLQDKVRAYFYVSSDLILRKRIDKFKNKKNG